MHRARCEAKVGIEQLISWEHRYMTTKIALITGAAIGIGRAKAFKFADNHYHVVVTDILSS